MKVAIPLFENRVSPHFSTAPELLLVQVEGGIACSTWKITMKNLLPAQRKKQILALVPDTLLCGGIDVETRHWFERHGVRVENNRMGDAMDMLDRYLNTENT